MNLPTARRKSDVVVSVISQKMFTETQSLTESIISQITESFKHSRVPIVTIGTSNPQDFGAVVEQSNILVIDKSLSHDLHGRDGIELIKKVQPQNPFKVIIAISSGFDEKERAELVASGVKFLIIKPNLFPFLKRAIELCIDMIELQQEIDHDHWKSLCRL